MHHNDSLELIMLGTGNAMVTKCYNTCFAIRNGAEYFLVDAGGGNGILVQLEKALIPIASIRQLFVTHGHTDHVLGVIWVIRKVASMMDNGQYEGTFTIYCHTELAEMIRMFCKLMLTKKLNQRIDQQMAFTPIENGTKAYVMGIQFTFFDICSTKMKQFGFRAQLPNAQVMVCLGDEPYNECCRSYVVPCDWLLSEAFCLYADRDRFSPYEKHHSTALDAGRLAQSLGVENLVLYHTEDKTLATRKKSYTEEVRSIYNGNIYVPEDLERILID